MSISKGGQSVKPYVGGKEVKEAYVGGQLVYRAVLPYKYFFLGGETDYVLNDCNLILNAAIAKPNYANTFKIALSPTPSESTYIEVTNLANYIGRELQLTARVNNAASLNSKNFLIQFRTNSSSIIEKQITFNDTDETLNSFTIPAGSTHAWIMMKNVSAYNRIGYLDNIRVMIE